MLNERIRLDASAIHEAIFAIICESTIDDPIVDAYLDVVELFAGAGGTEYQCYREGKSLGQFTGTPTENVYTGVQMIEFVPGLNIKQGDWLVNLAGEGVFVVETRTEFQGRSPTKLKAIVKSEAEVRRLCSDSTANGLLKRLIAHDLNSESSIIVSILG